MNTKKIFIPLLCIFSVLLIVFYMNFNNSSKKSAAPLNKADSKEVGKTSDKINTSGNSNSSTSKENSSKDYTGSSSADSPSKDITLVNTTFNTVGNTPGNLFNAGPFVQQGKWMYFGDLPLVTHPTKLYRSMLDGETGFKAFDKFQGQLWDINVVGEWVYFISYNTDPKYNNNSSSDIYKMKTDGTEITKLSDNGIRFITVSGDWIYYIDLANSGISKMKTDGTEKSIITSDITSFFNIDGDWIYYVILTDGDQTRPIGLYKIKLDGTSKTKVTDEAISQFIVSDAWLYYINPVDKTFNKIKTDGSNKIKLTSFRQYMNFNIADNWIYYYKDDDQANLYKMKTDGTSLSKITNNVVHTSRIYSSTFDDESLYSVISLNGINIIGDSIFTYAGVGDHLALYRVKLDGSLSKILSP